jgi:hypothetical protein
MIRIAAPICVALLCVACTEQFQSHYPTYADAHKDGAVSQGWIPAWVPKSALNIYEWHDLDTSATLLVFTYGSEDPAEFLPECTEQQSPRNPGAAKWWPTDAQWAMLEHYQCRERTVFADGRVETRTTGVALRREERRLFFWR